MYVCQLSFFLHSQKEKKNMSKFFASSYIQVFSDMTPSSPQSFVAFTSQNNAREGQRVNSEPGLQGVSCHPPSLFFHPYPSWLTWVTMWHFKQNQINTLSQAEGQTIVEKPPSQISTPHIRTSDPVSWPGWYKTTAISWCMLELVNQD